MFVEITNRALLITAKLADEKVNEVIGENHRRWNYVLTGKPSCLMSFNEPRDPEKILITVSALLLILTGIGLIYYFFW